MRPDEVPVLFLGCGDLGTGAAQRLFRAGFPVAIVELARPLAVRRQVALAEAARAGSVEVEGVVCRRTDLASLAGRAWPRDHVPLLVATIEHALAALAPRAVVDARLLKRSTGSRLAGVFHIVLGPGVVAGRDCDAVVETLRGPDLGRVILRGEAHPDTGTPGDVGGETVMRVLRAPCAGTLALAVGLGERVQPGQVVARVGSVEVRAAVGGLVRGLLADGDPVLPGQKLGDIDPRPDAPPADHITDKARAVGEGVLRALAERFRIVPEGA